MPTYLDKPISDWTLADYVDHRLATKDERPAPAPLTEGQIRLIQQTLGTLTPRQGR